MAECPESEAFASGGRLRSTILPTWALLPFHLRNREADSARPVPTAVIVVQRSGDTDIFLQLKVGGKVGTKVIVIGRLAANSM